MLQAGGVVGFDVTVDFANKPAKGDVRLQSWLTGEEKPKEVDLPVIVVQVTVDKTPNAFTPSEDMKMKPQEEWDDDKVTIRSGGTR